MRSLRILPVLLAAACPQDGKDDVDTDPPVDTAPEFKEFTLRFVPRVGELAFNCTTSFPSLGLGGTSSARFSDFRMFVSDIGFVQADGSLAPIEYTAVSPWTTGATTLLDFEDGTGNCEGVGDAYTHTEFTARVPWDAYTGDLAFTVGLPFSVNHQAIGPTTVAPLDNPALQRDPLQGYYYLKVDMKTDGEPDGYPVHVHATGCHIEENPPRIECYSDNLKPFLVPDFDVDTMSVVVDLAALLTRNAIDQNAIVTDPLLGLASETTPGCQSDANDPDCRELFIAYGLGAAEPTWIRSAVTSAPPDTDAAVDTDAPVDTDAAN